MKLNEKILYYRKRAGLSQEELASRVGVSRQAVSKWELGDATPEVDKLLALAGVFGVTTDELLSETDPEAPPPPPSDPPQAAPDLSQRVGPLLRLVRRYGWLAGVYIALSGAGIALVGVLGRYLFYQMFQVSVQDFFGGMGVDAEFPEQMGQMAVGISTAGKPFLTLASVVMGIGIVIMVAGLITAVVLYLTYGRKKD